jgi:AcrR family transcriptional regulator
MEYPRIPEKLDRRKKLMEDDIKTIKSLASQGYSKLAIAKRFRVSEALIYYHCKTEEQKFAYNQRIIELHMHKLKDPNYKRHHLDLDIESKKRKRRRELDR